MTNDEIKIIPEHEMNFDGFTVLEIPHEVQVKFFKTNTKFHIVNQGRQRGNRKLAVKYIKELVNNVCRNASRVTPR